jgi:MFS family permease
MAVAFACLTHTQGLLSYFLGTALAGFGFTLLATVPGTYLLTRLFPRPNLAFGLYFTLGGLGGVAGPFLYFWLAGEGEGWRNFWMVMGLIITACGMAAALFSDTATDVSAAGEADPEISTASWTARAAMATPQFLFLAIAYSAFLIAGVTANVTSFAHLTEARDVSAIAAGTIMSVEAAVNAAARFVGGVLCALVGARLLLVASLLALAAGMVALSFGDTLPVLLLYAVSIGLGYGLTFFASTILLLEYFGRKPNLELFSVVNLISTVGSAAPWLAGLTRVHSGSFVPFYLLLAVLMALIAAIALFLKPPLPRAA